MPKRIPPIRHPRILVVMLLVTIVAVSFLLWKNRPTPSSAPFSNLGGDFTLHSLQGAVSLHDFQDKAVVLMFGYTACPDICPGELATVAAALRQLPAAAQRQIQVLFISVDPARDTLQLLADYVQYFNPRFIGLRGEKAQIDTLVRQYGAFYRFVALPDSALGYAVDHTARLYLIDKQGQLRATAPHNTAPAQLADQLRALL